MTGHLPSSFDHWLTTEPEGKEPLDDVTLQQRYACVLCQGPFTEHDIKTDNIHIELEDDDGASHFVTSHKICEEEITEKEEII